MELYLTHAMERTFASTGSLQWVDGNLEWGENPEPAEPAEPAEPVFGAWSNPCYAQPDEKNEPDDVSMMIQYFSGTMLARKKQPRCTELTEEEVDAVTTSEGNECALTESQKHMLRSIVRPSAELAALIRVPEGSLIKKDKLLIRLMVCDHAQAVWEKIL